MSGLAECDVGERCSSSSNEAGNLGIVTMSKDIAQTSDRETSKPGWAGADFGIEDAFDV